MGTWGGGVFQSDSAADYLDQVCEPMLRYIEDVLRNAKTMRKDLDDETLLCAIDLLTVLSEHVSSHNRGVIGLGWVYPCLLPKPKQIEEWKRQYLEVWEANVDEYGPTPGYKRTRRRVIHEVFDRFARAARMQKRRHRWAERRIILPGKPAGQLLPDDED